MKRKAPSFHGAAIASFLRLAAKRDLTTFANFSYRTKKATEGNFKDASLEQMASVEEYERMEPGNGHLRTKFQQ